MMHFRKSLALLSALALLPGCSQPPASSSAENMGASKTSAAQAVSSAPKAAMEVPKPAPPSKGASAAKPTKTGVQVASRLTGPQSAAAQGSKNQKASAATATTGLWQTVKKNPVDIARDVDAMVNGISGVQVEIHYEMSINTGRASGTVVEKIRNPKVYSLQIPVLVIDPVRGLVPSLAVIKADGQKVVTQVDKSTVTRSVESSKPAPDSLALVQSWPKSVHREVFSGILDHRHPFTEYVKALMDKRSGYDVKVQERKLPFNGRTVDQYMISALRNKKAAKTLGDSTVYLVVDADIHLPVAIRADLHKPGATLPDSMKWDAKWINHQTFNDSEFRFPH